MDRPALFQVIPTDNYKVYLYYDNGEIKLYDCIDIDPDTIYKDSIKCKDILSAYNTRMI